MTAGPPDELFKKMWKSQPQEAKPMSVDFVRAQADATRRKVRSRVAAGGCLAIVLAGLFGWLSWHEADPIIRVGEVFNAIGALLIIWFACDAWPGDLPPPSATPQTIVSYYRNVLARQRTRTPSTVAVALPSLMGGAVIVFGHWMKSDERDLSPYLPIFGLMALWVVAYLALHLRRARALTRRIDELDGPFEH